MEIAESKAVGSLERGGGLGLKKPCVERDRCLDVVGWHGKNFSDIRSGGKLKKCLNPFPSQASIISPSLPSSTLEVPYN